MNAMIKKLAILMALAAITPAAAASSYYYGGYVGHGHGHGYGYGRHHGHYRHAYRRHHHHRAGYLAAGLLLGGVIAEMSRPRPPQRVVVSRQPVMTPSPAAVRGQPAPQQPPPVYLRRTADGRCQLVELLDDGTQRVTPESPDSC